MHALVLGFGQIGYRHFQGLLKSQLLNEITICDPTSSFTRAAIDEALNARPDIKVNAVTNTKDCPKTYQVGIIATCADVRLKLMKELLLHHNPEFLIIEKVPFQSVEQLDEAINLAQSLNVKVHINCPRRLFPGYEKLKEKAKLSKDNPFRASFSGGDWGMACNSLHFLDLIQYLSESSLKNMTLVHLDEVFHAKRQGFYEIRGTFRAEFENGSSLNLSSLPGTSTHLFELQTFDKTYLVVVAQKKIHYVTDNEVHDFVSFYQSEMTGVVVDELMGQNFSRLVSLQDAYKTNVVMLKFLQNLFSEKAGVKLSLCPIT